MSHQEQNRPSTHFFLLICNIRKSPPCLSAKTTPSNCSNNLPEALQSTNGCCVLASSPSPRRQAVAFRDLPRYALHPGAARHPFTWPWAAMGPGRQLPAVSPKFPNVTHQAQNRPSTHFSLLMCNIRKTPTCLPPPGSSSGRQLLTRRQASEQIHLPHSPSLYISPRHPTVEGAGICPHYPRSTPSQHLQRHPTVEGDFVYGKPGRINAPTQKQSAERAAHRARRSALL